MAATPILFLDGGLGTSLEDKYNVQFTEATPLWSSHLLLSGHGALESCQRDFAQVPVDILLTATYQVSVEGFQRTRTDSFPQGVSRAEIPQFLDAAVSIVEQVKQPATKIALSLGPYGAVMTPSQEYSARYDDEHDSAEKLFRWHADRIRLFASIPRLDDRVDFVAFETVPRVDEILAIRKLTVPLASQSPDAAAAGPLGGVPYWISCVFPGTGHVLPDGSSVSQVIRALLSLEYSNDPPWGIGINCTKIAELPQLVSAYEIGVRLLEESGHLRAWPSLLLYPDGTNGEVYDTATKTWKRPPGLNETAQEFVSSPRGSSNLPRSSPKHKAAVAGTASWLVDAVRPHMWIYHGSVPKFSTILESKTVPHLAIGRHSEQVSQESVTVQQWVKYKPSSNITQAVFNDLPGADCQPGLLKVLHHDERWGGGFGNFGKWLESVGRPG